MSYLSDTNRSYNKKIALLIAVIINVAIILTIGFITVFASTPSDVETTEVYFFTEEVRKIEPNIETTVHTVRIVSPFAVIEEPETVSVETTSQEPNMELLGTYRITAYCACEKCCGEWANNRPDGIVKGAANVELEAGVSVASPLPFGTTLYIEDMGEYVVQDRTASWVVEKYNGEIVDIYFDNHEAACEFGLKFLNVYLIESEVESK